MNRLLAEQILPYTNDKLFMNAFREVLQAKIALLQKDLATASDMLTIGRLQGGIQQLNRLLLLDEEVRAAGK